MAKTDTNWFQLDRYYTFEKNELFCVAYFNRGSNYQWTKEFTSQGERADFVREHLQTFRPFKVV